MSTMPKPWVLWLLAALVTIVIVVVGPVLLRESPPRLPLIGPALSSIDYEDVTFMNGGLRLAGMLMAPHSAPRGAAVFIHGSGTSRRDNPWYLGLAEHVRAQGFVVLLPDKRGSESSDGDWRSASFADLADDTGAAIALLRERFPDLPVGVIGASQGGWVAPMVANRDPSVAFVVVLSGPAVRIEEQLVHEETNTIIRMGALKFVAQAIAPITAWDIRVRRQKEFWDAIAGYDPLPEWRKLAVPAFIAYGAEDEFNNVPVAESVALLRRTENAMLTVTVYPGADHGIEDVTTGRLDEQFLTDFATFLSNAADGSAEALLNP